MKRKGKLRKVKRMFLFRHGLLGPDGSLLPKHVAVIKKIAATIGNLFCGVTDVFCSPLPRSRESSYELTHELLPGQFVLSHADTEALGSEELINMIFTEVVGGLVDDGVPLLQAISQVHSPGKVKKWQRMLAKGLKSLFGKMRGDCAISVGHLPLLPLVLVEFGWNPRYMDYLDYVELVMHPDGRIEVIDNVNVIDV